MTEELIKFVKDNDLDYFVNKETLGQARKRFNLRNNTKISANEFSYAVHTHCRYWKQLRRKPKLKRVAFEEHEWTVFKQRIGENLELLQGLKLREAVEVARTFVSCNESILRNLPRRFHVYSVR